LSLDSLVLVVVIGLCLVTSFSGLLSLSFVLGGRSIVRVIPARLSVLMEEWEKTEKVVCHVFNSDFFWCHVKSCHAIYHVQVMTCLVLLGLRFRFKFRVRVRVRVRV
jgi:hypothetical protein